MSRIACLVMLSLALAACKGEDDKSVPAPGTAGQPGATPRKVDVGESGSGSASATVQSGGQQGGSVVLHPTPQANTKESLDAAAMRRCPSAVTGATTLVTDTPEGIALTVTAGEVAAIADVRDRAAKAALQAASENGTGARCPVVTANTKIVVTEAAGGARLELTPTDKTAVDALRKEVRTRAAAFPAPPAPTGTGGETVPR